VWIAILFDILSRVQNHHPLWTVNAVDINRWCYFAPRYNKKKRAGRRTPRLFRYWSYACCLTTSLNVNWQLVSVSRKWKMLAAGERTIVNGGRKDGRIRIVKFFSFSRHNPAWNASRSVTYKATTAQLLKRNSFGFPIPVSLALYASLPSYSSLDVQLHLTDA